MPRLCTDAGRMLPGAGRWEFGPRGEGAGAPGRKSGSESGAGLRDRVRVGLRAGAAKAGCRSRVPRAASDRRKQGPEGVFCTAGSDVPPAKAPEPRVGIRKVCRKTGCGAGFRGRVRAPRPVPWTVPGVAAVSVVRGPRLIPGPGSGNRAGVRAPRRFRGRVRGPRPVPWPVPGACAGRRFPGSDRGLPKAFRLRRIFPRAEAFSAVHERRRGNPRSAFPSGGGPGSAGSRFPGAGSGCGRFLRRPHPAAENRGNPASPVKKETFQTGFVEEL